MDNLFQPCMDCSTPGSCADLGCWSEYEEDYYDGEDTPVSSSDGDNGA